MDGWFDRWAKRKAPDSTDIGVTQKASDTQATDPADNPPHSRRDFLVKAGLVGGAVWTVPAMQSVLAPASAASGTGVGQPCVGVGSVCTDGSICNGTICGGLGATCGSLCFNSHCGNGTCGGAAAHCNKNGQCKGHICSDHKCRGKRGESCTKGANCLTGKCSNAGICTKGSAGGGCQTNADCKTGRCNQQNRTCAHATRGGGCWKNDDCKNGSGTNINCSQPQSPEPRICGGKGAVCSHDSDCASNAAHACKNGHCKA